MSSFQSLRVNLFGAEKSLTKEEAEVKVKALEGILKSNAPKEKKHKLVDEFFDPVEFPHLHKLAHDSVDTGSISIASGLMQQETRRLMEQYKHQERVGVLMRRTLDLYEHWNYSETARYVLEPNDCSRLHRLQESLEKRLIYDAAAPKKGFLMESFWNNVRNTFVVRHDWAAAFKASMELEDTMRLPYDVCAFEFRITGHNVILMLQQKEGEAPTGCVLLEGVEDFWLQMERLAEDDPLWNFVYGQARAICIALEAEVAEHSVIRAPVKLNEKRIKAGKPPMADHHVVDLSRRVRAAARADATATGRTVRMHFRRGHWRRYEDHKTWIKWTLVGNPDLGFIDKHYRI